jgi:adenylosuccinate synthase
MLKLVENCRQKLSSHKQIVAKLQGGRGASHGRSMSHTMAALSNVPLCRMYGARASRADPGVCVQTTLLLHAPSVIITVKQPYVAH